MENKMYLTQAEADAKGLPSVQEQIARHNAAIRAIRATTTTAKDDAVISPLAKAEGK